MGTKFLDHFPQLSQGFLREEEKREKMRESNFFEKVKINIVLSLWHLRYQTFLKKLLVSLKKLIKPKQT